MTPPLSFPQFAHLPSGGRGLRYVYLIQSTDGAIKVGQTAMPRARLTKLAMELRRKGKRVERFEHRSAHGGCERELILRMNRLGTPVCGHIEWFHNVDWGVSLNLFRQIASRDFVTASPHVRIKFPALGAVNTGVSVSNLPPSVVCEPPA